MPPPAPGDLSADKLLSTLPRDAEGRPVLGGIPLLKKLGSGGMGAVYHGYKVNLKRDVAIKILPYTLVEQEPGIVKRFLAEARMAASLESEYVVRVIDVGVDHDLHYFVMQYVPGESAGALLRRLKAEGREGIPEHDALEIAIAATKGLAAAHARGIIHRDVKPDNILIPDERTRAKLADLGLAKPEGGAGHSFATASHIAMGTPGFMAPEQGLDAKTAGPAADVFAMGATLYSLLCGRKPFNGTSLMVVMKAAAEEDPDPLPPTVSPGVRSLVMRCLEKDPRHRYKDGAELLAALERVLQNPKAVERSMAPRAAPRPKARPVAPSKSGSVIALVACVAVAVAIGAAFVMKKKPAEVEETSAPDDLILQAERFERDNRIDDALATLARAAAIAPGDRRIPAARQRLDARSAASKNSTQKREAFRTYVTAADAVEMAAGAADTPIAWNLAIDAWAKAGAYATADDEVRKVNDAGARATQRKHWAEARVAEGRGNIASALESARKAATSGAPAPDLGRYIERLEATLRTGNAKAGRKREFERMRMKAAAEKDEAVAIVLWRQARDLAEDPPDIQAARDEIEKLTARLSEGERARNYADAVKAAREALAADQFDAAEAKYREALEARPEDPASMEGIRQIGLARSEKAYAAAMADADAAVKRKDWSIAKAAYERAVAVRASDPVAQLGLAEMERKLYALKPVTKPNRVEVVLDEAKKIRMEFAAVKAGSFQMGDVKVTLTQDFSMQLTEVTQDQWTSVMKDNPSRFKGGDLPVEQVTFKEIDQFVARLNDRLVGFHVTLPTEALWEWACRGTAKPADATADAGWFTENSAQVTHPAATKAANAAGLFDMLGNVAEWCGDWYGDAIDRRFPIDPLGPGDGPGRVIRGGGWKSRMVETRTTSRAFQAVGERSDAVGFRLAIHAGEDPQSRLKRISYVLDEGRKIRMEFVLIKAGAFIMGDAKGDADEKVHEVTLSQPFYMLTTEVTQAQWESVMGGNPSAHKGPDLPVENVNSEEAILFCKKLRDRLGSGRFALPTEAEWEYACRAGTQTRFWMGNDVADFEDQFWHEGHGNKGQAHPVAQKKPNPWGLYDMCGNVFEWCQDYTGEISGKKEADPTGPKTGADRILRGGSFGDNPDYGRSSNRHSVNMWHKGHNVGFRIVIR